VECSSFLVDLERGQVEGGLRGTCEAGGSIKPGAQAPR
jgi:hypothetical protein